MEPSAHIVVGRDGQKQAAAQRAAELVEDGMTVGLGSGTTVGYLLQALAARSPDIRCIASSPATETKAVELGLRVETFDSIDRTDLAVDGADQVAPDFWLIKGGGAAHTREKIVAASAERFVVIVDSTKLVDALKPPIPLELMTFGLATTLTRLRHAEMRNVPTSPDGGVIADLAIADFDPLETSAWLSATPGVVAHGLFPPEMVSAVLVGEDGGVINLEPPQADSHQTT